MTADAETLTPELELSAARMDLWCAKSVLANAAYWLRVHAGIPQAASVWYAHAILTDRAETGDRTASRKVREFEQAATAYEGARVALAELTPPRSVMRYCRNCGADLTASGVRGPYCSTGPDSCQEADRDDDPDGAAS